MAVHRPGQRPSRPRVSAGLLMYRRDELGELEVFIAHPGGPWFPGRDADIWTIPKGELEPGEEPFAAAVREFEEEVGMKPNGPYLALGSIKQKGGKTVHAWAFEGTWEADRALRSNEVEVEWPAGSGRWSRWPEIDAVGFFPIPAAKAKLKIAQQPLLDRLESALANLVLGRE